MASSTTSPVVPSQLCSRKNELYSPSQALVRTHMVGKEDKKRIKRVRCMTTKAMPAAAAAYRVPDMGKRQVIMNLLLLGVFPLPTAGMLVPYASLFVPPTAGMLVPCASLFVPLLGVFPLPTAGMLVSIHTALIRREQNRVKDTI